MKILRIFGVVVGVHVFALMLIFANPGCSSTNKPPPPAGETASAEETESPAISLPAATAGDASPVSADPDYRTSHGSGAPSPEVRFSPTRPGTPAAGVLEAQPVRDVTPATTYTVVSGDSLWTIARKNQLSVAELAAANNIKAGAVVRIGQRLIIPAKAVAASSVSVMPAPAASSAPATPRAAREAVRHVVRAGETLGAIARKYQVRVGEIATLNNIADPARIRPGMELTIPGWQAPGGGSATAARQGVSVPTPMPDMNVPAQSAEEVPTIVISPENESMPTGEEQPPVIRIEESP